MNLTNYYCNSLSSFRRKESNQIFYQGHHEMRKFDFNLIDYSSDYISTMLVKKGLIDYYVT
jgi:hypothetical protein